MACKMLFVWRGRASPCDSGGWRIIVQVDLRPGKMGNFHLGGRWHLQLIFKSEGTFLHAVSLQSLMTCSPVFYRAVYSALIRATAQRKPMLSSVCSTTGVHVERFEGPVRTSQVEEVTQHLVTMSRATPSKKRWRRQRRMIFYIHLYIYVYISTFWVYLTDAPIGTEEGLSCLTSNQIRTSAGRRNGTWEANFSLKICVFRTLERNIWC